MTVKIIRSDRKSISVRVSPTGVTVRAPKAAGDREIRALLKEKEVWIAATYERVQKVARARAVAPKLSYEELRALADRALKVIPERTADMASRMGVS